MIFCLELREVAIPVDRLQISGNISKSSAADFGMWRMVICCCDFREVTDRDSLQVIAGGGVS